MEQERYKELVGARVSQDTLEEIERLSEEHNISKSEAARRCIQSGLKVEKGEAELIATDGGAVESVASATVDALKDEYAALGRFSIMALLSMFLIGLWLAFLAAFQPPETIAAAAGLPALGAVLVFVVYSARLWFR